jgi:hypothetical protein
VAESTQWHNQAITELFATFVSQLFTVGRDESPQIQRISEEKFG